jgi:predicted PurR-regulated permease PerM
MSIRSLLRWFLLGLLMPLAFLNGWILLQVFTYFQSLVSAFVVATLVSFLLDYPVRWLERQGRRWRVRREVAVLAIVLLTIAILGLLGLTLAPVVYQQFGAFADGLPGWVASSRQQLENLSNWALAKRLPIDLERLGTEAIAQFSAQIQNLTTQLVSLLVQTAGRAFDALIAIVLAVYLLLRGDRFWDGFFSWLSPYQSVQVRRCFRQNFQNYYAGQAALATTIGIAMILLFLVLQVPFGLLFGLGIGVMTLVPFGAGISIVVVSLLLAVKSFWLGLQVLLLAFLVDQVIENMVAPRLLGQFTGLNPVWVLLSLLAGAKVGGLLGVVLAVPLAGTIKSAIELWRSPNRNFETALPVPVPTDRRPS